MRNKEMGLSTSTYSVAQNLNGKLEGVGGGGIGLAL